jgi:hypothetical protein
MRDRYNLHFIDKSSIARQNIIVNKKIKINLYLNRKG